MPSVGPRTSEAGVRGRPVGALRARNTIAAQHDTAAVRLLPLLVLVTSGALLHALGLLTFARLLDSPGRNAAGAVPAWLAPGRTLPLLSRPSAAVAQAQLRLALRTPRGRSILLSPLVVCVLVGDRRVSAGADGARVHPSPDGLSLARFGSLLSLLSILPLAMNQFAIDRAGLTLALLSPLATRELLAGKAVGNGLIAGAPALLRHARGLRPLPRRRSRALAELPLGALAAYLLVAPVAATSRRSFRVPWT